MALASAWMAWKVTRPFDEWKRLSLARRRNVEILLGFLECLTPVLAAKTRLRIVRSKTVMIHVDMSTAWENLTEWISPLFSDPFCAFSFSFLFGAVALNCRVSMRQTLLRTNHLGKVAEGEKWLTNPCMHWGLSPSVANNHTKIKTLSCLNRNWSIRMAKICVMSYDLWVFSHIS